MQMPRWKVVFRNGKGSTREVGFMAKNQATALEMVRALQRPGEEFESLKPITNRLTL